MSAATRSISLGLLTTQLVAVSSAAPPPREPLVHTFSIVARDPFTGQMGVAVQSHWFSVGSVVPWARAGVGAVATQSFVKPSYGPDGLERMRGGQSAPDALAELLKEDDGRDVRQVAMIDATGRVSAHTGSKCIAFASHLVGDNYSVQANLMHNDRVVPAMRRAFELARGDLANRMLAALEAAQREGGDIRGRQSAAILIVSGEKTEEPWQGRMMELRIEDHPQPLVELRRLIQLHRAYEHSNRGDELLEKGDFDAAVIEFAEASRLAPEIIELKFWQAVTLFNVGREKEASVLFREVCEKEPIWFEVIPRLVQAGLLPSDRDVSMTIVRQSREARKK